MAITQLLYIPNSNDKIIMIIYWKVAVFSISLSLMLSHYLADEQSKVYKAYVTRSIAIKWQK